MNIKGKTGKNIVYLINKIVLFGVYNLTKRIINKRHSTYTCNCTFQPDNTRRIANDFLLSYHVYISQDRVVIITLDKTNMNPNKFLDNKKEWNIPL